MKYDNRLVNSTILTSIIVLVFSVISYIFIDKSLALYIKGGHINDTINSIAMSVSIASSPKIWAVITAIVTAMCLYQHIKYKKTNTKLYTMSLTLIMTIIIATTIKVILARYRPEMLMLSDQYGFHFFSFKKIYNSLPSGHTALSFAGLLAIANFSNKKSIMVIAICIGILIAVCRVITLDHYLTDVVVAAYIGIFTYLWSKNFVESGIK